MYAVVGREEVHEININLRERPLYKSIDKQSLSPAVHLTWQNRLWFPAYQQYYAVLP